MLRSARMAAKTGCTAAVWSRVEKQQWGVVRFFPYRPLALQYVRFMRFQSILSGVPNIKSDDDLEYWCRCKHSVIGDGFRCHQHHATNLKNNMEPLDNHSSGPYIVVHAAFKFVKIGLDRLLRDIFTEQNARAYSCPQWTREKKMSQFKDAACVFSNPNSM